MLCWIVVLIYVAEGIYNQVIYILNLWVILFLNVMLSHLLLMRLLDIHGWLDPSLYLRRMSHELLIRYLSPIHLLNLLWNHW